jgi:hypothetical protein
MSKYSPAPHRRCRSSRRHSLAKLFALFRHQRRTRDPRARDKRLADGVNQPSLNKRIVTKLVGGFAV